MLFGPRSISQGLRRVCLPCGLARSLHLAAGAWVRVERSATRPGELFIGPAPKPGSGVEPRDPDRPRRVNPHGQVALPARLLAGVGLDDGQRPWVYFAADDERPGLRVIPARLVTVPSGKGAE